MKNIKSTLTKFLCTLLVVCTLVTPVAVSAKPGDVAGLYYATDIVSVLNGSEISSINIGGQTLICAEDMLSYGFSVIWDGGERSLSIAAIPGKRVTAPTTLPNKNNVKTGTPLGNYYETDIITRLDGVPITSFNVGGTTYIHAEAMLDYGYTVIWNGVSRKLFITSPAGTTPSVPPAETNPLRIVTQPTDKTVNAGASVNLTVKAAGGTSPYKYAWYFRNESGIETKLVNGASFSGATTASLKFTASGTAFSGDYRCVVTDAKGKTVDSESAEVKVTASTKLSATISPQHSTVGIGKDAEFSVSVSGGTAPYKYTWYGNSPASYNYDVYYNTDSSVFTLEDVEVSNSGSYWCVVTDVKGRSVTTEKAELEVPEASASDLYVYMHLPTMPVKLGSTATFKAEASGGTAPYVYLWYCNTADTGYKDGIFTDRTSTLQIKNVSEKDIGTYWCLVRDADGNLYMTPKFTLSVTDKEAEPLSITAQPKTATVAHGSEATFEVKVTGGNSPYTYDWQRKALGVFWTSITSETELAEVYGRYLTLVADYADWTGHESFRCVITDANGSTVTTEEFTLKVTASQAGSFKITKQPESLSVADGETATFEVAVSGGKAPYTYNWQREENGLIWNSIENELGVSEVYRQRLSLVVDHDGWTGNEYFRCVITDANGRTLVTNKIRVEKKTTLNASFTSTGATTAVIDGEKITYVKLTSENDAKNLKFKIDIKGGSGRYLWQLERAFDDSDFATWEPSDNNIYNVASTSITLNLGYDIAQRARAYRVKVNDTVTGEVGYSDTIYITYPLYARYLVAENYSQVQVGGGFGPFTFKWMEYDSSYNKVQDVGIYTPIQSGYFGRTSQLTGITNRKSGNSYVNEGSRIGCSRYVCVITDAIGNSLTVTEAGYGSISQKLYYNSDFWNKIWTGWYPAK